MWHRVRVPGPLHCLLLSSLGACAGTGPDACDTGIVPAVQLEVVDAATGFPAGDGAKGIVWEASYVDSLRPVRMGGEGEVLELGAADARPGTYAARVEKAGYLTWEASGLETSSDGCHPSVRRRVALVPAAAAR